MALVDRALRWRELGEDNLGAAAQDEEFVYRIAIISRPLALSNISNSPIM